MIFDIVDGSILPWSSILASKLKINIALLLPERTLKDAPQMDIANIVIAVIIIIINHNILWSKEVHDDEHLHKDHHRQTKNSDILSERTWS